MSMRSAIAIAISLAAGAAYGEPADTLAVGFNELGNHRGASR